MHSRILVDARYFILPFAISVSVKGERNFSVYSLLIRHSIASLRANSMATDVKWKSQVVCLGCSFSSERQISQSLLRHFTGELVVFSEKDYSRNYV